MRLTRTSFGQALAAELDKEYDVKRIARWAYEIFLDTREFDHGLRDQILSIVAMEQGKEFEFTLEELRNLSIDLQN
jgi:hypothetical protein